MGLFILEKRWLRRAGFKCSLQWPKEGSEWRQTLFGGTKWKDKEQWAHIAARCKGNSSWTKGKNSSSLKGFSTARGWPEGPWNLHPWRPSKLDWTRCEQVALTLKLALFERGGWTRGPQRSLPISTARWEGGTSYSSWCYTYSLFLCLPLMHWFLCKNTFFSIAGFNLEIVL